MYTNLISAISGATIITVALGVDTGLIEKDFIRDFFSSIYKIHYSDYYFFIEDIRRTKGIDAIWINFTNLTQQWHPELKNGDFNSTIIKA
jgi:hypothetical protein